MPYFKFKALLQNDSWMSPAYVGTDSGGLITYLSEKSPDESVAVESIDGLATPGFMNAHSHAFQYAMAGLAETHPGDTADDFWSWREAMYQCALSIDPDQAEAIAVMLYSEMLRHGYTHVVEFHYLHHDQKGNPYANPAEMGERMLRAAQATGIKITLIPVFYQQGGFGQAPQDRQRRFISRTSDDYFKLLEASSRLLVRYPSALLGFSAHSLRAVALDDIRRTFQQGPKDIPFHLHIAEQRKEVTDCFQYCGKRPAQWLLENLPVNERFHLVHATHLDDQELKDIASSGATVVLCPSTEGNLGDGIFRMKEYGKLKGHWTIGTDSHIGLNPLEELRMIDYRQRLITNQRNTFEGDAAKYLIQEEITRGRMSMGVGLHKNFAIGQPLDAVVYHASTPLLQNTGSDKWLSVLVYSNEARTYGTLVDGQWKVRNGVHSQRGVFENNFSKAIRILKNR
jgi:formimidoylglutamate deiminase